MASTSKPPAARVTSATGGLADAYNQALGGSSGRKVVAVKGKQRAKLVVDKGKGKARAVDDDDDEVHTTSSAKILARDFVEEMDDEARYTVVKEPGAIDLGAVWNYDQKWATEVHAIRSEALRRNLKGYRRVVLLWNDEWYDGEEDDDEEVVGDGIKEEKSDMELQSEEEEALPVVEEPQTMQALEVEVNTRGERDHTRKRKGKKPVDIRDKLRMERQREAQEALGLDMIVPLHGGDDYDHEHHHPAQPPVHDGTINPALLGGLEADAIQYADWSDEEDAVVMGEPDVGDGDVDAEADTDTDGEDDVPLSKLVARRRATSDEANKDQRQVVLPEIDLPQLDNDLPRADSTDDIAQHGAPSHPDPSPHDSAPPPAPKPKGKGRAVISSMYPTRPDGAEIFCHQCRRWSRLVYMQCRSAICTQLRGSKTLKGKIYCKRCIIERYDDYEFVEGMVDKCPACEGTCSCDACTRKRGEEYLGPYVASQKPAPPKPTRKPRTTTATTARPSRQIKRPVRFVEEQAKEMEKEKEKEKRGWRTVVTTRPGLLSGKTMWEPVEARIAEAGGSHENSQAAGSLLNKEEALCTGARYTVLSML
ncbi:hypothetical protein BDZ89DRAFT_259477 [Hymenopellis radicata]|nr:hypothetical protein BDZ89DRAFT_259477 [Hymenopellis radicata]